MISAVKDLVGHSVFGSGLHGALLRDAGVVVVFHHVRDEPDALTIGVDLFDRYCRFFQRHFNVVALSDLADRLARGAAPRRELAITFDDGYLDNFENAAPILERYSLPATFFVVTGWMGSQVVPWWDRHHTARPQWMSWDHVRSLHRRGFDIGAHTRNHVDLGIVSGDEARDEIVGARLALEEKLDAPVHSFAYPYGGRHNFTEANRALVKAAGFRCCCSGFGGSNTSDTDPFHIYRVAVTPWNATPHQFGVDIALGLSQLTA